VTFGIPPGRRTPAQKLAEQQRQIVELWLQRPKRERTTEDVLAFYGWLSDHQSKLVPSGPAPVRQLREILKQHIVELTG